VSLPYYKFYTRDWFDGTQQMTLEQKGAYIMVLNLIYTRNSPVADEDKYLARYVGCSIRKWQKLRLELIGLGKLVSQNGLICNSRADEEIIKRVSYVDQKRENRSGTNEIKAVEKRASTYTEPDTDTEVEDGMVVDAHARDLQNEFDDLEANCRKWAKGSLNLVGPAAHDLSPIVRLLKPPPGSIPCVLDDVRLGITKVAAGLHAKGKQVGTLGYFEKPIIRERDLRLQPLPEPEINHERAGQGQSGQRANGRGGMRAGAGGKHGASAYGAAWEGLFGGGAPEDDLPDGPEDGRVERVA
jgi:uncharacterized protein YdaU (DUF1376 family)